MVGVCVSHGTRSAYDALDDVLQELASFIFSYDPELSLGSRRRDLCPAPSITPAAMNKPCRLHRNVKPVSQLDAGICFPERPCVLVRDGHGTWSISSEEIEPLAGDARF